MLDDRMLRNAMEQCIDYQGVRVLRNAMKQCIDYQGDRVLRNAMKQCIEVTESKKPSQITGKQSKVV